MSTLSGPGAGLGVDIRDGFNLAVKQLNGKLGGLPAEILIADDQQNPDVAKQATDKLLKKDKVDFMSGIVFSNIMLAVGPAVFQNQTFYISANAGRGRSCRVRRPGRRRLARGRIQRHRGRTGRRRNGESGDDSSVSPELLK